MVGDSDSVVTMKGRGLRVVYFPIYSNPRALESSPSYNYIKKLVHYMRKAHDDVFFYICFPRMGKTNYRDHWQFANKDPDSLFNYAGVKIVFLDMYTVSQSEMVMMTKEFWDEFNEITGKHYYDVVLNERPELAPILRKLVGHPLDLRGIKNPIVNTIQQIPDRDRKAYIEDEYLMAAGSLVGRTYFQSPHHMEKFRKTIGYHLSPSLMLEFDKRARVIPMGIDLDELTALKEKYWDEKPKTIGISFSRKMYNFIKYEQSLDLLDRCYKSGRNVRVNVITPSSAIKHMPDGFEKYAKVMRGTGRHEFLEVNAKENHVFIVHSPWEDFSMTTVEQLGLGLIGILPNLPWARYLVGDDYPFLFDDNNEALAMLKFCADDYQKAFDMSVPRTIQRIKDMFDMRALSENVYNVLYEAMSEDTHETLFPMFGYEVSKKVIAALPDPFTMDNFFTLYKEVTDYSIDPRNDIGTSSTSKLFYYRLLKAMGCKDDCLTAEPLMHKPEELLIPQTKERSRYTDGEDD